MLGGSTLTLNTKSGANLNFSGVIADSGTGVGALVLAGSGTQTLSGASSYAGPTIVNGGTLIAGNANAFGATGNDLTVNGGTANLSTYSMTNGVVTLAGGTISGSGSLTANNGFNVTGGTAAISLAGTSSLTMSGTGTATLANSNSYSGGTYVSGGSLVAGNSNSFGKGVLTVNGGTADLGGLTMTNALSLTGGNLTHGILSNSTGNFDLQSGNVSATLAGAAGATKSGNGTVNLSGNNTYTGATTVNGGALSLGATGSLSNTASVSVASGSTLLLGAANQINTNSALSLGGTISMGANGATRAASQIFSSLTLTSDSVIDFANLSGNSLLAFGSINLNGHTLSIYDWSGSTATGLQSPTQIGTFTSLYNLGSLTGDLASISFYSGAGTGFLGNGTFSGNEIVPVPEPAVIVAAFMLLGLLVWSNRGTIAALASRRA
jgi:autotransporter-associated beta strand protein